MPCTYISFRFCTPYEKAHDSACPFSLSGIRIRLSPVRPGSFILSRYVMDGLTGPLVSFACAILIGIVLGKYISRRKK